MKRKSTFVLLGVIFLFLFGCVTAKFSEPAASFQEGINKSSVIVRDYYKKTNDFERDVYLNECMFNPEKELLVYEKGKPTPLLYDVLSPESIKARADALTLIGIYANRLGELAGNESPEIFSKNSFKLGDNLEDLSKAFADLSSIDSTAVRYSGAVSKIVGIVGKMYLERSRDKAIAQAIKKGYPAVNKVLNLLQNDLNDVIIPLQKTGLRQRIAEMSVYYNQNRGKLTVSRRKTELSRISDVVAEYNSLIHSNPANLIQGMKQANDELAKYAESSKTPRDFAEFMSVLERFNIDVNLFAESIK